MKSTLIGIVGICLVAMGCGGADYDGAKRYPLTGKVSFNGEPIDFGSISFIPQGEGRVSGGTIENGAYDVPEELGANAGMHRVEIRWQKKTGKKIVYPYGEDDERAEGLPAEFHSNSTLTAEIGEGNTTFDFELKSDAKPPRAVPNDVPARYRK